MKYLYSLFLACVVVACGDYGVEYEKEWHSERHLDLEDTLVELKVENCGIYKYKASTNSKGEYLVRCSKNGSAWTEYSVSTVLKNISDPRLPSPKFN